MKWALPWLVFTYLLAPAAVLSLLLRIRRERKTPDGVGNPSDTLELGLVSLALTPFAIHWLVVSLYSVLPHHSMAFYRWMPVAVFSLLAVLGGGVGLRGCVRAGRALYAWCIDHDSKISLVQLCFLLLLLDRVSEVALDVLTGLVYRNDDTLQYATVARLIFERGDADFYIFREADPVTGFYVPMTHPLGFPAVFLWNYLVQGHADLVGVGVSFHAWVMVMTLVMLANALRRLGWIAPVAASALLLSTPIYVWMLNQLAVDPPLALLVLTLVTCLSRALRRPDRVWCCLSGVALGLCLFMHSIGAVMAPLALSCWAIMRGVRRRGATVRFAVGMALVAALIGGQQYVENQLLRGRPLGDDNPVWDLPILKVAEWFRVERGLDSSTGRIIGFLQCWAKMPVFGLLPWVALGALALALFRRPLGRTTPMARMAAFFCAGYYAIVFTVSFVAGSDLVIKNPRYFCSLLPLFAILAAMPVSYVWSKLTVDRVPAPFFLRELLVMGVLLGILLPLPASIASRIERCKEAGPAMFHADYMWRPTRTHPLIQLMRYIKAETPPEATILAHPMAHVGFYTRRKLLSDLDPRLVNFYVIQDTREAGRFLASLGVDYIVAPDYTIPTFQGSIVERMVGDPTVCELVKDFDGPRLFRLLK